MGKVLILNADYAPVTVCSVERAIILLFTDKAEIVVESAKKKLRTARENFPFPSVVRLLEYVRLPFKKIPLTKRNVFRRDNFECQYCGTTKGEMTVDHIIPSSKGGEDSWQNLTTACKWCNNYKGDTLLEDCGLKLKRRPTRPNYIIFLKALAKEVDKNWEQYLFV